MLYSFRIHLNLGVTENDKEKLCTGDGVDVLGSVTGTGPSAALTPAIWDKTIPYDGETFHLEYMDLEEFLMENGISANAEDGSKKSPRKEETVVEAKASSLVSSVVKDTQPAVSVQLLPILELDQCQEEVITDATENATGLQDERINP